MAPKKKKLGTGVVAGGKRKKIAKAKANVEPDTDSTTDAQTEPPRSPTPPKDTATTSAPARVPSTSTSMVEAGRVIGTMTQMRSTAPKRKGKVPPSSTAVRADVSESEANSDIPVTQASSMRRGEVESSEEGGGGGVPDKSKIILTDDETSTLIEFVKSNAPLWQRSHANFKKEKEKYFIWQAGLETMKCFQTVDQIKAAWTNIRDTFTKMLREKNKSGGADFQPKGSKRIIIWSQANFLSSNLSQNQPSNLTVGVKKRRVEPGTISDFDEDLTIFDSTPNSQPISHLPHEQLAPSRQGSSASAGTSGRTASATAVGGGGGDSVLISQSLVESLLKDKEVQIESLKQMVKRFPSIACEDGGVMSFCNWLSGILMRIPEPTRSIVQGQISGYALSVMPTEQLVVPTMGNYLQNMGQTLPPPPNYQPTLQHQQQQPPVHQQHQQHQQAQQPQFGPQQPLHRGRSASAPVDYFARQSPAPMRPPPPITRMPSTPRSGTGQGPYYQYMPEGGWSNTTNVPSTTSSFQVFNSANVDNYMTYGSNLATDSAGRTVNLQDVSPANFPTVTTSVASPTLNTPVNCSNLSSNPPSVDCNLSIGQYFSNFQAPMSTSSVKSTEADALSETSQVVTTALASKNSE